MPSPAMLQLIDVFRDRRTVRPGQAPPALEEFRAGFAPAGRVHPLPDDVLVTEVTAGGVPAHWLDAPGASPGQVLLFVHGGGFKAGSVRSHGELAARLGRASRMRVLFPEYRLAPEHPFPAAIDDVLAAWRWLRRNQDVRAGSIALAGDSVGGGLVPVNPSGRCGAPETDLGPSGVGRSVAYELMSAPFRTDGLSCRKLGWPPPGDRLLEGRDHLGAALGTERP